MPGTNQLTTRNLVAAEAPSRSTAERTQPTRDSRGQHHGLWARTNYRDQRHVRATTGSFELSVADNASQSGLDFFRNHDDAQ